jgi:hypothetical protein
VCVCVCVCVWVGMSCFVSIRVCLHGDVVSVIDRQDADIDASHHDISLLLVRYDDFYPEFPRGDLALLFKLMQSASEEDLFVRCTARRLCCLVCRGPFSC